ncbi:NAD(P)/FAD-dependent oxidoreductase [Mycolicibacterium sp.]|uniref:NAD(P)/FAD-dependent oxidoreductase n=1 Tax=Mycolicibacterium sp. TaxID=2320850 RepID=UPI0037CB1FB6
MISDIAIIGSGVAGVSAAQSLRTEGYDGRLFLIGEEPGLPYDRTALSKAVLGGDLTNSPLLFPADWYDELQIDLVLGKTVRKLDVSSRAVLLDSAASLTVDRVLLATGAAACVPRISGVDLPGVATLRTADDTYWLRQSWRPGQRLIVVGGGLIGCEVATTARNLGLEVTILEVSGELLQRVLGRRIGGWCRARLEELGIAIQLNTGAAEFIGTDRLTAVTGTDGRHFVADNAIVCIGAQPNTAIAEQAGLACSRGIVVDDSGGTAAEGIFSAGDAAAWPLRVGGRRSLETYINSQKEASAVAAAMLGRAVPAPQLPLSWTEIAGHYIQMIGDIEGCGEFVMRGDPDVGPALLFRLTDGRVTAAVSIDAPRDFAMATRLVEKSAAVRPEVLGDSSIELRELFRAARAKTTVT